MKTETIISTKQAMQIASSIYESNFRCFGIGHFDIELDEFAEIILTAFNSKKPNEECLRIYERLR